ncbi:MAG: hypothetical protein P8M71_10560 [Pseudomonadales bacterium]|nr:hypothetical protein [Pseudomonadales bacterium]
MKPIFTFLLLSLLSLNSYSDIDISDNTNGQFFTDQTPSDPIDGNYGKTIGEQRLYAIIFAEKFLESIIDNSVGISISLNFDNLSGSLLASARPTFFYGQNQFSILPNPFAHYPVSLAEQYLGFNINPSDHDIFITVGSSQSFYYGFSKPPFGKTSFVGTVIHEILHGLGFYDNISGNLGASVPASIPQLGLYNDSTIFDFFLKDKSSYLSSITYWFLYTPAQMLYAINAFGVDRVWFDGLYLKDQVQSIRNSGGRSFEYWSDNSAPVQLLRLDFQNNNAVLGFTSSHFWEGLNYNNELMEGFASTDEPYGHIGLAKPVLKDIGWPTHINGDKPKLSPLPQTLSFLNEYPYQRKALQFAVWDNDNEKHQVTDYGVSSTYNPAHPNLYFGIEATSSNQNLIQDQNLQIFCSSSNNPDCSLGDLYYTPVDGASGSSEITITVWDIDGNTDTESVLISIQPNSNPDVIINSPSDGHIFLSKNQLFAGQAYDQEDGSFSYIDWGIKSSDASSFQFSTHYNGEYQTALNDGDYLVVACVQDSDNNSACSTQLNITVSADQDFDNDGLSNSTELELGLDPYKADTDGDSLLDGDDPSPLEPQPEEVLIPMFGGIGLLALGLSILGLGAVRLKQK